jgi:hypothetical protein
VRIISAKQLLEALLVGDCQAPAAMRPAAGQYLATVLAAHALPEAVFVRSFSPRWLISPFHFTGNFYDLRNQPFFKGTAKVNLFSKKSSQFGRRFPGHF